jgi:ABC-type multidrug transport system fused ATPase/permease subunit
VKMESAAKKAIKGKLVEKEDRAEGLVGMETWMHFLRTGGLEWYYLIAVIYVCASCLSRFASFWLASWGSESLKGLESGNELTIKEQTSYLNTYAMISFSGIFLSNMAFLVTTRHAYNCCAHYFAAMLKGVLRAPIAFFDVTPSGRIINRFTGDVNLSDMGLSAMIGLVMNFSLQVVVASVTIIIVTDGTFLLLFIPLGYVYYSLQLYFRKVQTEIKRLSSIAKSPVYTEIGQSLSGITSVRAFGLIDHFHGRLSTSMNSLEAINYVQKKSRSWLDIRLSLIGSVISFFVVAVAVWAPGFMSAEYLAVGLSASTIIPFMLAGIIGIISQADEMLSSVERMVHFSDDLPIEDPSLDDMIAGVHKRADDEEKEAKRLGTHISVATQSTDTAARAKEITAIKESYNVAEPPASWPSEGKIEFIDVSMSYRNGPLILKNVSCVIEPTQKVGVCGRTGSGKSSMLVALFRVEKLKTGKILIDGIDIATVPVKTLRSRVAIVPQDPVMFSATMRYNIDPHGTFSDADIWEALSTVTLKETVQAMPGGLDAPVAEGGSNLSVGQRQLVCFTRALLRQPKVVVMDEATAAVDNATDDLIQGMIREKLKDCTILTIAHRLNTIIDSDRVVVLEGGNLGEYGPPDELKTKPGGIFAQMWATFEEAH